MLSTYLLLMAIAAAINVRRLAKLAVLFRLVQLKTWRHAHPIRLFTNTYPLLLLNELLCVNLPLYLLSEFFRHLLYQCLHYAPVKILHKSILFELLLVSPIAFPVHRLEDNLWDELSDHVLSDELSLMLGMHFFEGLLSNNSHLSRHEFLRKKFDKVSFDHGFVCSQPKGFSHGLLGEVSHHRSKDMVRRQRERISLFYYPLQVSLIQVIVNNLTLRYPHGRAYLVSDYIFYHRCANGIQYTVLERIQIEVFIDSIFSYDLKNQVRQKSVLNVIFDELVSQFDGSHVPLNNFGPSLASYQSPPEECLHFDYFS
jgi:hypothetical protein